MSFSFGFLLAGVLYSKDPVSVGRAMKPAFNAGKFAVRVLHDV